MSGVYRFRHRPGSGTHGGVLLTDFGALRIEARIGEGGMGTVYRARGPDGRLVAVKLLPEGVRARARRTRFLFEVSCLARLDHPGVVRVLGAGHVEGRPWLAMDLVEAPDLQARIQHERQAGRRGLPLEEVLRIFRELANALAALRLAGVVHRDIKPANILVREGGRPVLVDFGLAKIQDEPLRLTRTGAMVGTLDFLAPEQIRDGRTGPEVDYYALGLSLWIALVGANPYPTLSATMRAVKRAEAGLPPVTDARPGVPEDLATLVGELTELDPSRRLCRPGEVARRLGLLELASSPRSPAAT